MNMLQSISQFLKGRRRSGTPASEGGSRSGTCTPTEEGGSSRGTPEPGTTDRAAPELEDSTTEGELSELEAREDIARRSSLRQSVKRAIGWRKSQRKAINKRKKSHIFNSKLLTGGGSATFDEDPGEFYDDVEIDAMVQVVIEPDGSQTIQTVQTDDTAKKSRIPRRRSSAKRPAVSLKSSSFFSQPVSSKKAEGVKPVTARKNKAFELREEANKKKREAAPGTNNEAAPPVKRKLRNSFRTKKGLSRRPLHKKEIKPAENKASQLRAMKHQDELEDPDQTPKPKPASFSSTPRKSDRCTAVELKTAPPSYSPDSKDPLLYSYESDSAGASAVLRTSTSDHTIRCSRSEQDTLSSVGRTSGRATKAVPAKPTRARRTESPTTSQIPTPIRTLPVTPSKNKPSPDRELECIARRPMVRSDKVRPCSTSYGSTGSSNIPKANFNPVQEPSAELMFIPLDSVSLPLPREVKIDEVKRKRKMRQRPVSNIFEGGQGELPTHYQGELPTHYPNTKYQDYEPDFKVHVNKTPTKGAASGRKTRINRTPSPHLQVSRSLDLSPTESLDMESNNQNCRAIQPKPKQLQNISNFTRQNSGTIESPGGSKNTKTPSINLLKSASIASEGSDQGSCVSFEEDDAVFKLSPPILSESAMFSDGIKTPKSALFSTDDLENQIQSLKTPRLRSGSIRIKMVKTRKSWIKCEDHISPDSNVDKLKNTLITSEALIIEDLMSGHDDITNTLSSRTLVLKNMAAALRRSATERAARLTVSLCFPRTHGPDEEFQTMRRACRCTSDDLALFQNCLAVLLVDRDKLTLPVVAILVSKIRVSFEIMGCDALRGTIGDLLRLITNNFGNKIVHRETTPGLNYRLYENAEECFLELQKVKKHIEKLTLRDCSPLLMALKKTLELFDIF